MLRVSKFAVPIGVALLFWLNEARTMSRSTMTIQTEFRIAAKSKTQSMEAMLTSMSVDRAVSVMEKSGNDQHVIQMIKENLGKAGNDRGKKVRGVTAPQTGQPPGSKGNSQSYYGTGVWAALHRMNDMLLETIEKWDLETITCENYDNATTILMEEINEDLNTLKVLIADALSDKDEASNKIQFHKDAGDKVESDIKAFLKEMTAELTSLNAQLKTALGDSVVMEKILNMTECRDTNVPDFMQMPSSLMQCTNKKTGHHYQKVKIQSEELRRQLANMKHPKVVALLRAAGINVDDDVAISSGSFIQKAECGCGCHNDTAFEALFGAQMRNNTCNEKDANSFSFLDDCCVKPVGVVKRCCPAPTLSPAASYGVAVTNTSSEVDPAMQGESCKIGDSDKCPELRERFLNIDGGIWDTITQLRHLISQTEFHKEEGHRLMQAELAYHNRVAESENEKLGRAIAVLATLLETQRMKNNLLKTTLNEYNDEMERCRKMLAELVSEECALKIIRGELLKMNTLPNNVTDCMTSDWEQDECSLTCGGGTHMWRRSVEIEPDHGYNCPALSVKLSCNTHRCPLDCELGDWTGWSACSAMCDGGVMDRIRPLIQHDTKGGTPCGTQDEDQDCNTQACDKDCVLHEWTEWSPSCTKVCGGGRQIRYKHIKEKEYGKLGTCPEFHDARRFQWKPCNTQPCVFDDHKIVLCEARLDIILALDVSGSITSAGWQAMQMAAAHFAGSMGSGIKLGALVFDSARFKKEGEVCMGRLARSKWKGPWTNCGVRWAKRMTFDTGAVQQAIRDIQPTNRGTMTNQAVDQASAEFDNAGRTYANSVMIVFTDGYPQSKLHLTESAERFKKKGRLLFVTIGDDFMNDEDFQSWASYPYQDNIVSVADYKELTTRKTLNTIVSDFCPNIQMNDDPNNPPIAETSETMAIFQR